MEEMNVFKLQKKVDEEYDNYMIEYRNIVTERLKQFSLDNKVQFMYTVWTMDDAHLRYNKIINDIRDTGYTGDIVEIQHIFIEEQFRGMGLGNKVLRRFCFENRNKLLVVKAGILSKECARYILDKKLLCKKLNMIVNFYIRNGFLLKETVKTDMEFYFAMVCNNTEYRECKKVL